MRTQSKFPMLSMEEAEAVVLREARALPAVQLPLEQALGHVVCEDVASNAPVPSFRASIMDGFAVCSGDGEGEFEVVGEMVAGVDPNSVRVTAGKVAYVTTGGPVPDGADAVIQIEKTTPSDDGKRVAIHAASTPGQHIREIGSDCREGEVVVAKGEFLHAAEVGLCAMVGVTLVSAHARPRVAVMSTGDELVPHASTPPHGKIRDSNRPMLLAALQSLGYSPVDLGMAPDTREGLLAKLNEAREVADLLITSGGVSMGKLDLLKPLLEEIGTIHFGRLRMKPGKPTTFGTVPRDSANPLLVFALPGNPVSALVTMSLLVVPALRALQGHPQPRLHHVHARIATDVQLDPERPEYHRVVLTWSDQDQCYVASSTGKQRSSRLLSLRSANGLLVLPQQAGSLPKGSLVKTILLPALAP